MRYFKNSAKLLMIIGLLLFSVISCGDDDNPVNTTGNPVLNTYLRFYDYLDLETGWIDSAGTGGTSDTTVDFWIAYNSIPPDFHGAVFHRSGREIAILDSTKFSGVTQMLVDSAAFTTSLQSDPFDTTRVFLLKTNLGAIYKIGNPVEDANGVTFDYSLMQAAP